MEQDIVKEMENLFGADKLRIDHAFKVLNYSKIILEAENADTEVVVFSAILHDIGIPEAERKYNSSSGNYQEIEGPPIAKKILTEQNVSNEKIDHICKIIANHHSAKDIDTIEFRIIWDSDWLVNIESDNILTNKNNLERTNFITKIFKTATGKKLAKSKYLI